MNPTFIVISKSPLGRAFAAFLSKLKPGQVVLLDPESRRAELMQGRRMNLDFGSEFSKTISVPVMSLKDFVGNFEYLKVVKWAFSFQVSSGLEELRKLRAELAKKSTARWVYCDSAGVESENGDLHVSFPWKVTEKFFGRLKVLPGADLAVSGKPVDQRAFARLVSGHLCCQLTEGPAPKTEWKAWASRL